MVDHSSASPLRTFFKRSRASAEIRGGERKTFAFRGLGKIAALGHRSAVAEVFGVNLSGFFAWWMWPSIYLMKLPGWGRRLKVASSWTLDLVLPPELVQLKRRRAAGAAGSSPELVAHI